MSQSLLQIAQAVMGESGFLVPTAVVNSPNPDDVQLLYLANRAAAAIVEGEWQRLVKRNTTTLTTATTYALPSDYLEIVPDTMRLVGRLDLARFPTSPGFWSYLQSMSGPVGIPVNVRIMADLINVYSPSEGDVMAFEYFSNAPILAADASTTRTRFALDTDLWQLDDDLLILETRWRFLKAKGLPDWDAVMAEARQRRILLKGRDIGAQTFGDVAPNELTEPFTNLWVS